MDPWIVLSPSINRDGIILLVLPVVNVGACPGPTSTWQAWPQQERRAPGLSSTPLWARHSRPLLCFVLTIFGPNPVFMGGR